MILEGKTGRAALPIVQATLSATQGLISKRLDAVDGRSRQMEKTLASQESDAFDEFQRFRDNKFRSEKEERRQFEDERDFGRGVLESDRNFGLDQQREARQAKEAQQRMAINARKAELSFASSQARIGRDNQTHALRVKEFKANQAARAEELQFKRDERQAGIDASQSLVDGLPPLPIPFGASQPEQLTSESEPASINLPDSDSFFSVQTPEQGSLLAPLEPSPSPFSTPSTTDASALPTQGGGEPAALPSPADFFQERINFDQSIAQLDARIEQEKGLRANSLTNPQADAALTNRIAQMEFLKAQEEAKFARREAQIEVTYAATPEEKAQAERQGRIVELQNQISLEKQMSENLTSETRREAAKDKVIRLEDQLEQLEQLGSEKKLLGKGVKTSTEDPNLDPFLIDGVDLRE